MLNILLYTCDKNVELITASETIKVTVYIND